MIETRTHCPLCGSANVEHSLLGLRTHCLACGAYACDVHHARRCPHGVCGWQVSLAEDGNQQRTSTDGGESQHD